MRPVPSSKQSMPVVAQNELQGVAVHHQNFDMMGGGWQQTKNAGKQGMFYLNKQEQKIDECKQSLLLQLQQIKDMDSVLVESKNKSIFL